MKHFSMEEWVDFARGAADETLMKKMRAHLESGCGKCAKEAAIWQRVQNVAQRREDLEPSEAATRTVKGFFSIYGKGPEKRSVGLVAQQLFDSLLEPLPSGVRSTATAPRQLLFEAESLRIDVRLEPIPDSGSMGLIGQALDSSNPQCRLEGASVALFKSGKLVAETKTNHFGEFQLQCDQGARLELRIQFPSRPEVSVFVVEPEQSPQAHSREVIYRKGAKGYLLSRKGTSKKG